MRSPLPPALLRRALRRVAPWLLAALLAAVTAVAMLRGGRRLRTRRFRRGDMLFRNTREAILITDAQRRIVAVNPAYTAITGYTLDEVVGRSPRLHQSGRQGPEFYKRLWAELERTGQWEGEIWNRRKNGDLYAAWESIAAVRNRRGRVVEYVAVLADITPLMTAHERMQHIANHDALTGLPNRLMLQSALDRSIERAKRHRGGLALLFVDLDRFKQVNDVHGHDAGDRLLRQVADALRASVRGEDLVARLSGDEFVILYEDVAGRAEAIAMAAKVADAITGIAGPHGCSVSASVGAALYPDDGDTGAALMRAADVAMYAAKRTSRQLDALGSDGR